MTPDVSEVELARREEALIRAVIEVLEARVPVQTVPAVTREAWRERVAAKLTEDEPVGAGDEGPGSP